MDTFTTKDEYMFRIAHAVDTWGFFIQYILGDRGRPPWAYTIGFAARGLPEFVVMGLDDESAAHILHWVHRELAAGRTIRIGRNRRHAMDNLPLRFVPVLDEYLDDRYGLFCGADGYYESTGGWPTAPRFLQVVWAENGALPWAARFPKRLRRLQPLLDLPGSLREPQPLDGSEMHEYVDGCPECERDRRAGELMREMVLPAGHERIVADFRRTTGCELVLRLVDDDGEPTVEVELDGRFLGFFDDSFSTGTSEADVALFAERLRSWFIDEGIDCHWPRCTTHDWLLEARVHEGVASWHCPEGGPVKAIGDFPS